MKQVQVANIEKAINKVDNMDDDGLEALSETYALAQQNLLGYVMSAAVEYENEDLEGLLIYYYCLICEAFTQEQILLNQITDDDIDDFQEEFFETLDAFFDSDNEEILHEYTGQSDLVNFMLMEVSTPDSDGTTLDDETATQLFVVTMAMITLMGRAIKA